MKYVKLLQDHELSTISGGTQLYYSLGANGLGYVGSGSVNIFSFLKYEFLKLIGVGQKFGGAVVGGVGYAPGKYYGAAY